MNRAKKRKTEEQKAKFYSNTISKIGKWRGKKADEYVKYKKKKKIIN